METLKTAVIGTGNMGQHHARVYSELSELAGIADIRLERAQEIAGKYNTTAYSDFKEMLAKEKPDAVSVVVPTELHAKVGCEVLKHCDVIVEKPIAMDGAQADQLISTAEENNRVFTVGQIERFNPVVEYLKQNYGDFLAFNIMRLGFTLPEKIHTSVIVDLGIHDIDVIRYLTGEEPTHVEASARHIQVKNFKDHAHIFMQTPSTSASIVTNWISPRKIRHMYVVTENAFIYTNYITQEINVYEKTNQFDPHKEEGPVKTVKLDKEEPLKRELGSFLNAVREKSAPAVTGEDAKKSLLVALKADRCCK